MYIFHYIFPLLCTYICTIIPLRVYAEGRVRLTAPRLFWPSAADTRFRRFQRSSLCRLRFTRLPLEKIFPRFSPYYVHFSAIFFSNFFQNFFSNFSGKFFRFFVVIVFPFNFGARNTRPLCIGYIIFLCTYICTYICYNLFRFLIYFLISKYLENFFIIFSYKISGKFFYVESGCP